VAKDKKGKRAAAQDKKQPYDWIPLWGWALIFAGPLLASEYMFYRAGRTMSMILFPVAWVIFWFTLMQRSGWPILKKPEED